LFRKSLYSGAKEAMRTTSLQVNSSGIASLGAAPGHVNAFFGNRAIVPPVMHFEARNMKCLCRQTGADEERKPTIAAMLVHELNN
jgi:hypothetical protein